MPLLAKQMKHLSIVRSMSTREADHNRGRYYMHTGLRAESERRASRATARWSPTSWKTQAAGAARFRRSCRSAAPSEGPGFLGMTYAPFQVDANGHDPRRRR